MSTTPTEAQRRYMATAARITDTGGHPAFCIDAPGRADTGRACLYRGWLEVADVAWVRLTPAGRAALENRR